MSKNTDKKTRILVVDNNTIYLEMISVMLGDEYKLEFADDGHKALDMLRADKDIALIITALHMPYMSGIELLMEVKKGNDIKDVPVIVLTEPDDNEAACLSLGAVDFIKKKPFPMHSVVIEKIEKALKSKQNTQAIDLDSYINTLFSEYQTVYLINVNDFSFDSFSEDENYRSLNLKQRGADFFSAIGPTIINSVYEEDHDFMLAAFEKEAFMKAMQVNMGLSLKCRLFVNNKPIHYSIKAMLIPDSSPQIIIGIKNSDEEVSGMEALYAFRDDKRNDALIAEALASDYMCIYYVHLTSNRFVEYRSIPEYAVLRLEKSGENFFTFALKSFIEGVNPIDKDRVARQFTRENVINTINEAGAFTTSFRLTFEESDAYVALKATKLINNGEEYLVVGINNIDAQVKAQLNSNAEMIY